MKADPHIILSDFPLTEGGNYEALCGRTISNAAWGDAWIACAGLMPVKFIGYCAKCVKQYEPFEGKIYLYGAVDGESLRNQDTE